MKYGRNKALPYALVAPALCLIGVFMLYPMISNFITSLYNYKLSSTKRPFVGLANYANLLHDTRFWTAAGRTLSWTLINLAIIIVLGVALAMFYLVGLHPMLFTWVEKKFRHGTAAGAKG